MSFSVEASSPSKDQGVRLAPAPMAPDDEVPTAAHGPELSRRVPVVRKGSGGLLAHVLRMPPSPCGMAGSGRWPPCGDFGGGVLPVSRQRNIPLRS